MFTAAKGKKRLKLLRAAVLISIDANLFDSAQLCCEATVMDYVDQLLNQKRYVSEAAAWPDDFDYFTLAYKILYNVCYDLLSCGRLHLCRGFLSPVGDSVYALYIKVLEYYEANGLMEGSCMEEQLDIIDEAIASVG